MTEQGLQSRRRPAATVKQLMPEPGGPELETGDGWLAEFLPYQLYRVTNRLNMRLQNRLRAIGISASQWRVLSVLRSHGTLTIGRIAEHALMEQPTVSRVVDQLELDGLVVRRIADADSRRIEVRLTAKGVAAFVDILPFAMRHQKLAFEGLSPGEILTLRELLARIERNIDLYD